MDKQSTLDTLASSHRPHPRPRGHWGPAKEQSKVPWCFDLWGTPPPSNAHKRIILLHPLFLYQGHPSLPRGGHNSPLISRIAGYLPEQAMALTTIWFHCERILQKREYQSSRAELHKAIHQTQSSRSLLLTSRRLRSECCYRLSDG